MYGKFLVAIASSANFNFASKDSLWKVYSLNNSFLSMMYRATERYTGCERTGKDRLEVLHITNALPTLQNSELHVDTLTFVEVKCVDS